jgi:hypothetical protein
VAFVNALAVAVLVARMMQSLVHICLVQTNTVAIRTLRVLFRADRQLSVFDWDPADQSDRKRITGSSAI